MVYCDGCGESEYLPNCVVIGETEMCVAGEEDEQHYSNHYKIAP